MRVNEQKRRSSSLVSEELSKRSSLSIANVSSSNLNLNVSTNQHNITNIQKQTPNEGVYYMKAGVYQRLDRAIDQQLMTRLKKTMIQSYRIVKKHVKENVLTFTESDLREVYQNMSAGLKVMDKIIAEVLQVNLVLKDLKWNGSGRVGMSKNGICSQNDMSISAYTAKIKQLQKILSQCKQKQRSLLQQKQKQIQQLRLMIQSHQQEMMYTQLEYKKTIEKTTISFEHRLEILRQEEKQRRDKDAVKMSEQLKKNSEQSQNKMIQVENKWKGVVERLISKLKEAREIAQFLQSNLNEVTRRLNQVTNQYDKLQQTYHQLENKIQDKSQNDQNMDPNLKFMSLLQRKLANIMSNRGKIMKRGSIDSKSLLKHDFNSNGNENFSSSPHNRITVMQSEQNSAEELIEKMFVSQQVNNQVNGVIDQNVGLERWLQTVLQKLGRVGFFSQENEENVMSLVAIGKAVESGSMSSHTLYPLVVEKVKLTLCDQLQQHSINDEDNGNFANQIIDGSNEGYLPSNNCVRYRNINSIEQLQVSDSMICDYEPQNQQSQYQLHQNYSGQQDNYSKAIKYEKQVEIVPGKEQIDSRLSPIVDYAGYGHDDSRGIQGFNDDYDEDKSYEIDQF